MTDQVSQLRLPVNSLSAFRSLEGFFISQYNFLVPFKILSFTFCDLLLYRRT